EAARRLVPAVPAGGDRRRRASTVLGPGSRPAVLARAASAPCAAGARIAGGGAVAFAGRGRGACGEGGKRGSEAARSGSRPPRDRRGRGRSRGDGQARRPPPPRLTARVDTSRRRTRLDPPTHRRGTHGGRGLVRPGRDPDRPIGGVVAEAPARRS